MRKAANRLTKNGKRRGRPPLYLSLTQIEAPLGVRSRSAGKILCQKASTTTLLIVQREVAKRGAKYHTKKEIASLTALRAVGSERGNAVEIMARRLRRIDASVGINRL
jgi:hypothetical protein